MSNNLLQSIDSISREVQNNGIMKIDNFLNQEDINLIEKIYGNKKNTKGASASYIYR